MQTALYISHMSRRALCSVQYPREYVVMTRSCTFSKFEEKMDAGHQSSSTNVATHREAITGTSTNVARWNYAGTYGTWVRLHLSADYHSKTMFVCLFYGFSDIRGILLALQAQLPRNYNSSYKWWGKCGSARGGASDSRYHERGMSFANTELRVGECLSIWLDDGQLYPGFLSASC